MSGSFTLVTAATLVTVGVVAATPTVIVTVRVSVPPLLMVPIFQIPVPLSKDVAPDPVAEIRLKPVGSAAIKASVTCTPVALDGPLFVAVTV